MNKFVVFCFIVGLIAVVGSIIAMIALWSSDAPLWAKFILTFNG